MVSSGAKFLHYVYLYKKTCYSISSYNSFLYYREDVIKNVMNYLETDTVLYRSEENDKLKSLQEAHWDPVIAWASERHRVNLRPSYNVAESLLS